MKQLSKINSLIRITSLFENWGSYILDRFKLLGENGFLELKLKNGIRIKIRKGTYDRLVINEIWVHEIYNPIGFEIRPNDIIVDVGSHIGSFSLFASRFLNVKIYSLEPHPENFDLLKSNIEINNIKNIKLFQKSVASKTGIRKLYVSNTTASHSFFKNTFLKYPVVGIRTHSISLKDLCKKENLKRIDFLKIDCEGNEYDILFNTPSFIFKKIKKIAVECHYIDKNRNLEKLVTFLRHKGFDVSWNRKKEMVYAKREIE